MKVLAIIPAYNEEKSIKEVCDNIEKVKYGKDYTLDYIVINDCSKDKTEEICTKNNIPIINLVNNLGIGGAVQTGYKYAYLHNYDIAIQFDGDNQHDANYIDDIVKPIINNECEMTVGSRYVKELSEFKSTFLRQFGIKFLSTILKTTTGKKIYDVTSGMRAINKDIIKIFINDYPIDYPEPETLVAVLIKGYKIKEVPVKMHERKTGRSSITPISSIYYMTKVSYSMIMKSIIERRQKNGK